jgi:hypothetical protein
VAPPPGAGSAPSVPRPRARRRSSPNPHRSVSARTSSQGTVVVLIACLVVGTFLYVNDQVWKRVVSKILLGE